MTGPGARWRALGALLLVFLAGAGVGWAAGVRSDGASGGHGGRGRGGPRPRMLLDAGPVARYNLSAAQRARVDSILGARRGEIDAFWRGPGVELRRLLDATATDVRAVLTPEQQAMFDSARAERRRMRERMGPGGPPFGPPPDGPAAPGAPAAAAPAPGRP